MDSVVLGFACMLRYDLLKLPSLLQSSSFGKLLVMISSASDVSLDPWMQIDYLQARPALLECVRILRARNQSLGFAESCTGGLMAALLVAESGVSDVFDSSVVTYSNESKQRLLGVDEALLNEYGAVSEEVAVAMAEGLRRRAQCDWAVSITGIAGPSGGTVDKPVGTVCFAVVGSNGVCDSSRQRFMGERGTVQAQSVGWAAKMLLDALGRRS